MNSSMEKNIDILVEELALLESMKRQSATNLIQKKMLTDSSWEDNLNLSLKVSIK